MNREASLRLAVDVSAPPDTVWAAATDWGRQGEWVAFTDVYVTEGDGRSMGSRIAAFTGMGGIGFLDLMEIVKWEPPRRCAVRHCGRLLRGSGEFVVRPRGAAEATFVWAEEITLPLGWLGVAGWQVLRPVVRIGLRRSLRSFARFCGTYREV